MKGQLVYLITWASFHPSAWSVPWFYPSRACFEVVGKSNHPLGSHVSQRMWFPRYEKSINPLLFFHSGMLTSPSQFLRLTFYCIPLSQQLLLSFRIACTRCTFSCDKGLVHFLMIVQTFLIMPIGKHTAVFLEHWEVQRMFMCQSSRSKYLLSV